MQQLTDAKMKARVQVFDSASELVLENQKYHEMHVHGKRYLNRTKFVGRRISTWQELTAMYHQPWPEGRVAVDSMLEKISGMDLPQPKDVRRRLRWDDDHGEIDVDRYLAGEEQFYRRAKRNLTHGPRVISIVTPIGANCDSSAHSIFWRSAAVIAAVEKLEEFGYSCEITAFWHSNGCYDKYGDRYGHNKGDDAFVCYRVKEAGDHLYSDIVTNSLSAWFFRTAIFGILQLAGNTTDYLGFSRNNLAGFEKYIGNQSEALTLHMPSVLGERDSLEAIRDLINQVSENDNAR